MCSHAAEGFLATVDLSFVVWRALMLLLCSGARLCSTDRHRAVHSLLESRILLLLLVQAGRLRIFLLQHGGARAPLSRDFDQHRETIAQLSFSRAVQPRVRHAAQIPAEQSFRVSTIAVVPIVLAPVVVPPVSLVQLPTRRVLDWSGQVQLVHVPHASLPFGRHPSLGLIRDVVDALGQLLLIACKGDVVSLHELSVKQLVARVRAHLRHHLRRLLRLIDCRASAASGPNANNGDRASSRCRQAPPRRRE
jgi:hypothetical protein